MSMITEKDIDKNQIITVALKYGTHIKPLKVVAFAQLTAKALFLSKKPLNVAQLQKEVALLLNVSDVAESFVNEALAYLEEIRKVSKVSEGWLLKSDERKVINCATNRSREDLVELLKRHFPEKKIERKKLKNWFQDTVSELFGHLGDSWVISISKGVRSPVKQIDLLGILSKSVKRHDLLQFESELTVGFNSFLHSDALSDQKYILYVSQAMFGARLVAADIGVDTLSLNELKDAVLILDTNVIFAIMLESHKLALSLVKLEKAFRSIGIRLRYLHSSKEEYERVLFGKRNEVLNLLPVYKADVLSEVKDDFISTAIVRQCSSLEDYERFFDSLSELPSSLDSGYEINLLDDKDIMEKIEEASKNSSLKATIQKWAKRMRRYGPKSETALCHDASLIQVAEYIRREEKCWVLSLDRSLLIADSRRTGVNEMPNLLSIAALIEIFATNSAGPDLSADDMAPLLSSMITNECAPADDSEMAYTLSDLKTLHIINESAADLPKEDIQTIARQIAKARVEGKDANSVDLQTKVNRLYQTHREDLDERLKIAKQREESALEKAKQEIKEKEQLEKQLVGMQNNRKSEEQELKSAIKRLIFTMFIGGIVSWVVLEYGESLYCQFFKCEESQNMVRDFLDYGWPLIWLFFLSPLWRDVVKIWNLGRVGEKN